MPTFFQIKRFLRYWLHAVEEHSLHSPFFYDFYTKVVKANTTDVSRFEKFEEYRRQLLKNNTPVARVDFGAGSVSNNKKITVSSIARDSSSPKRYSDLYTRIIAYFKHTNVLELGTSLGINTLYLSSSPSAQVTSFEGDPALISFAEEAARSLGIHNIQYIEGNIDQTLEQHLLQSPRVDFAFLDANHQYNPTLRYSNILIKRTHPGSVVVLDDIHLSPAMEKAWNELRSHELVYASADLYRCGILFFDPSLNKQHVVLQF